MKKNLATLRGSDGQGEGPVFIQGGIRGVRHFPKKNARKMAIGHVHVHFDCAGSHKTCSSLLGRGIFSVISRIKWLL